MTEEVDSGRREKSRSRFSIALVNVLRAMEVPNKVWARWLGVSEGAVSQWTTDVCAPSPRNIYRIVAILRDARERLEPRVVQEFENALAADASEVIPNGARLGSTIGNYMLKPLRESLLSALETLPTRAQEEVILSNIEACTAITRCSGNIYDLFASVETRKIQVVWQDSRQTANSTDLRPAISDSPAPVADRSPEGLRGLLAMIACEMHPLATRLAEKPASPKAARESLWKLDGCAHLAAALDDSACAEPVLSWVADAVGNPQANKALFRRLRELVDRSLRVYHKQYALESEVARALDQAGNVETLFFVEADVSGSEISVLREILVQSGAEYPMEPLLTTGHTAFWCKRMPRRLGAVRWIGQSSQVVVARGVLTQWQEDRAKPPRSGIELLQSASQVSMAHAAEPLVENLRRAEDPWEALRDSGPQLLGETVASLPRGVAEKPTLVTSLAKTLASQLGFT